jgi:hypothetical protein
VHTELLRKFTCSTEYGDGGLLSIEMNFLTEIWARSNLGLELVSRLGLLPFSLTLSFKNSFEKTDSVLFNEFADPLEDNFPIKFLYETSGTTFSLSASQNFNLMRGYSMSWGSKIRDREFKCSFPGILIY